MKKFSSLRFFSIAAILLFGLCGFLIAEGLNNNEVEFTGTISSVAINGEGVGTVFVRFDDLELRVIVNSSTELSNEAGKEIGMSDLAAGDLAKVKGKFSASGVVASELQLLSKGEKDFQVRGRITNVQASGANTLISLLGITVVVTPTTKIHADGATAPVSDLKVGQLVQAEGTISGNTWTATSVEILPEGKKKDQVRFVGTVLPPVTSQMIQVETDGVPGSATTVLLNQNTRIVGDLVKGALVEVTGTLNSDLSVNARAVVVLQALEIKPDERKLKTGETATFIVKLRETASSDVTVSLKSSDASVLSLSTNSLTIPKGQKAGTFSATGLKTGSVVITAEALGQKATAEVKVGEVSENENEKPAGQVRVAFAPDKIKMGLNETRDVVLLIQPPQKSTVPVTFAVKSSLVPPLVTVVGGPAFNNGAAALKVTIQSGSKEGTASVIATLPTLGGAKAELVVEVSDKPGEDNEQKVEIDFRPDEVKLAVGETRTVNLRSNKTFDKDVTVSISGGGGAVKAPTSVVIPVGSRSVGVSVTGQAEGKATLIAALPGNLGGDTAKLDVEVKNKK